MFTRILREPLLHFLLIGSVLFAAYSLFTPPAENRREAIIVDKATVESLEAAFESVWKRAPTQAERSGLIEDHLAEEVLYREARKLGLEQDDLVIRRRLRQKMEFLLQDSLNLAAPEEAELRSFYEAEKAKYREADRRSFRQIFLGSETSTAEASEWEALAVRLNGPEPPATEGLGAPSLLPEQMEMASAAVINRVFGRGFASKLDGLETGRWSGPVASAYGWHLIWLEAYRPGGQPSFEAVRNQVERDFGYQRELDAKKELVERLKQNYDIVIEEAAQ